MNKYIEGQNITNIWLDTGFGGQIWARDDKGNQYKMSIRAINGMLNDFKFKVEMKRKWKHLTEADYSDTITDINGQAIN